MRIHSLDFLRGIAIIFVLGYHCPPVSSFFYWGWSGVDLFFVLSGFLVTGLLLKEYNETKTIKPFRFLARRGLKIYPAFYVYIVAMIFMLYLNHRILGNPKHYNSSNIIAEILFVQNYFPGVQPQTWSLGIEEHFYIFLTLFFVLISKYGKVNARVFLVTYIVLFLIAFTSRAITFSEDHFDRYKNFYPTHVRMDALFWGALLSFFYHNYGTKLRSFFIKNSTLLSIAAVVLLLPLFFAGKYNYFGYVYGLPMIYLGYGIILIKLMVTENVDTILMRVFPFGLYKVIFKIGFFSYSIYLWHIGAPQMIIGLLSKLSAKPIDGALFVVLYMVLALTLGIGISKLLEQPILRFRDRILPKSSKN